MSRPLGLLALLALPLAALAQPGDRPPPAVPVMTVEAAPAEVFKTYTGRTEAHRHVEVRAQVDGILESREYVEGESVTKGDRLFRIDPRPYRAAVHQAEADLTSARASLAAAQRDWKRIRSLYERDVASEQARDDARSALDVARAQVEVAEAKLEAARINLDYTEVTAPIPGITSLRAVSEGNLIAKGDRLLTIQEIDPIQVVLSTPVDDPFADSPALNPSPGDTTPARLVGITGPNGEAITGELDYRAAEIDRQTNAIRLRGVFTNPGKVLRPNRYVRVRLQVAAPTDALAIPETAITSGPRPNSTAVLRLDENDKAQLTLVELGPASERGRIVESGLEPGDRIVVDGLVNVRPGSPVTPKPAGGGAGG